MIEKTENQQILDAIATYRLIQDRVNYLSKLGYELRKCSVGNGGVGSVFKTRKETRIQIGSSKGRYNYAFCVVQKNVRS